MEKRRVNYRLINISKIDIANGLVEIHYSIFPMFWNRVAVYQIQEVEEFILNQDSQNANTIEFLTENYQDILIQNISEFHFTQQSITFKNTIDTLRQELKFLRNKIKYTFK